jgi:L-ascorbate metabolism protein UlaG (beta-lactamase superfamily)
MKIQRLSWAGIKLEYGSTTLFIDAISDAAENDPPLTASTAEIHALLTHQHGDHFDPAALKTVLNAKSKLICHADTERAVNANALPVFAVSLYEPVILSRLHGEFLAFAVPAVDGLGDPQVSWVIDAGDKRIIHCGDTLWHGQFHNIARAYGPFDLAFMPINGVRQEIGRFIDAGIPICMTPEQAVAAVKLLGARAICPIHYGGSRPGYEEVPNAEALLLELAKAAGIETKLVQPGDWIGW